MASCLIDNDALATCTDQLNVGGLKETVYLMNADEIDSMPLDANFAVENIVLATGAQAYRFDAVRFSNSATATYNNGDNKNWTHQLALKHAGFDQIKTNLFEKLAVAKIVAVCVLNIPNFPTPPIQQESKMIVLGRLNYLRATQVNTAAGPGAEVLTGYDLILESFEVEMPKEVIPDPTIYTSNTPNKEFLDALIVP